MAVLEKYSKLWKRSKKVDHLTIKFDQMDSGTKQREDHPIQSHPYASENGTPLFRHNCSYNITGHKGKKHQARANILQFPVKLAWAMTCHKMQVSLSYPHTLDTTTKMYSAFHSMLLFHSRVKQLSEEPF